MAVYFALSGGYVKIGYSGDPISRVSTITVSGKRPADIPRAAEANLIGWVPGDVYTEMAWHVRFTDDRVTGEWFYVDPDIIRELIWEDPRGIDVARMTAMAVFAAVKYPEMTRDEIEAAGIRVDASTMDEALARLFHPERVA